MPLGRLGQPDDIARWIGHLADRDADWVTGTVLTIDGGRCSARPEPERRAGAPRATHAREAVDAERLEHVGRAPVTIISAIASPAGGETVIPSIE